MDRPGPGSERACSLLEIAIELFHRRHDGEDHAWDREVEIAEKQPIERIGKNQFFAEESQRDIADQALPPGDQDDHEADNDAGEGQRKRKHRYQNRAAKKSMPLQK